LSDRYEKGRMGTPPGSGLEHRASNPVSVKKFNRYRNLNNYKVIEALCKEVSK
jgi:hypothetical protein